MKELTTIPDISGWNLSKVNKMNDIFFNCKSLTNISNLKLLNIKSKNGYNEKFNLIENNIKLLRYLLKLKVLNMV